MRVLITGVAGFVGPYMAEHALAQGAEVVGATRWHGGRNSVAHLAGPLTLVECDLRDAGSVLRLVERARPDAVIHLAAQSSVPASWDAPRETLASNVDPLINLGEALRLLRSDATLINVGSSEEYGLVRENELPVREENPLRPQNPYAVSKVAQDLLGYQYAVVYGLRIIRTRAFNHTGPRQSDAFAIPSFARQLAEIERGKRPPVLSVGNLEASRDFTDVRDIVRAYWLLLANGLAGEVYNVCSGQAHRMRDIAERLLALARTRVELRADPRRMRPSDLPAMRGDHTRLTAATGWQPLIPLDQTLQDTLDYWRKRVLSTEY
ncbi:MAG: GDP-mannose 4,6-dehydratase [Chloroflexi bacterium]|nr:GDP-mannose 4,6-dehydratase [Chloroflexota bacterium]